MEFVEHYQLIIREIEKYHLEIILGTFLCFYYVQNLVNMDMTGYMLSHVIYGPVNAAVAENVCA